MKHIVTENVAIKAALATATTAQQKYHAVRESLDVALHPEASIKAAKLLLADAKTAEAIKEAQGRLFALQGEAAELGRKAAVRAVRKSYDEFKATLIPLIESGIRVVESAQSKAVEAEREFFSGHGLAHEATQVSRRFKHLVRELNDMKTMVSTVGPPIMGAPLRNAFAELLAWFK